MFLKQGEGRIALTPLMHYWKLKKQVKKRDKLTTRSFKKYTIYLTQGMLTPILPGGHYDPQEFSPGCAKRFYEL